MSFNDKIRYMIDFLVKNATDKNESTNFYHEKNKRATRNNEWKKCCHWSR